MGAGVIWESLYWRKCLLSVVRFLKRVRWAEGPTEQLMVRAEKVLLMSFHTVRKLMEPKLTDATKGMRLDIRSFPVLRDIGVAGGKDSRGAGRS